jgi:hypothetical protein
MSTLVVALVLRVLEIRVIPTIGSRELAVHKAMVVFGGGADMSRKLIKQSVTFHLFTL